MRKSVPYALYQGVITIDLGYGALVLLFFVAVMGAFISAIAGAGGLLVLPVLLWVGVPPVNALATNKVQSVFGTVSSALNYFRHDQIQLPSLAPALVYALVGAAVGTLLVQRMDPQVLAALIPALLILVALYLGLSPKIADTDSPPRLQPHAFGVVAGGGVGFYGGFFGPGMGSFAAAAFAGLRGYNMRRATGNAKPLVLVTNGVSVVLFAMSGQVLWKLALVMAAGQIIGARLGSGLVLRHGTRLIKPVIVGLTLAMAAKLLWESL